MLGTESLPDICSVFDEDYYERGIVTGKSCYMNYRWLPELTIPLAISISDFLGIKRGDSVLDFGCAKGFLVKAFRLINRECWGYDVSDYAIRECDPSVKKYCHNYFFHLPSIFDFCIAKDVFEHVQRLHLLNYLREFINAKTLFVIVPLGDNGKYRIPAYELDKTHVIRENEHWWEDLFGEAGWVCKGFSHRVCGIKDNWAFNPRGNGFFVLERG